MDLALEVTTLKQDGADIRGVDARELHKRLANGTPFRDWIRRRVQEYELQEGRDFFDRAKLSDQKRSTKTKGGDRRSKNYLLTVTAAKELAMVERTDQGREIRRYLIDLEERAARGDITLAAEVADRASHADQAWLAARMQGKVARNTFTATLQAHGVQGRGYGDCTNAIYRPLTGSTAVQLRKQHNLGPKATARDVLPLKELFAVGLAEILAAERIEKADAQGNVPCQVECSRAARDIAQTILAA